MFNRSASLAMAISVLETLPGKLDIKRHSPSILYLLIKSVISLESPYHLAVVSGAHFTQGTILIVILVSSGSAKSRTHQFAVGGFLVTRRGRPGRPRACTENMDVDKFCMTQPVSLASLTG